MHVCLMKPHIFQGLHVKARSSFEVKVQIYWSICHNFRTSRDRDLYLACMCISGVTHFMRLDVKVNVILVDLQGQRSNTQVKYCYFFTLRVFQSFNDISSDGLRDGVGVGWRTGGRGAVCIGSVSQMHLHSWFKNIKISLICSKQILKSIENEAFATQELSKQLLHIIPPF